MALQTSGTISMYDICAEFGVAASTSIFSLYRGGGIVPDSSANSGVPTSGTISVFDFYGASDLQVTVNFGGDTSVYRSNSDTTQLIAQFKEDSNVVFSYTWQGGMGGGGGFMNDSGYWKSNTTFPGSGYEAYATVVSLTSGTAAGSFNTWISLDSNPGFGVSGSTGNIDIDVTIRRKNEHGDVKTQRYSLTHN